MPQRRRATRRKEEPLGPYDLSTRQLLGGTEIQALAAGYAALEQKAGYDLGYADAAGAANNRIVRDTGASYLLGDITKPHGVILRAMELKDVLKEYGADISSSLGKPLPNTESTQRKMLDGAMGLRRGQVVADGLPAEYKFVVKDGLVITHVAPARKYLIAQDKAAMNSYVAGLLNAP